MVKGLGILKVARLAGCGDEKMYEITIKTDQLQTFSE